MLPGASAAAATGRVSVTAQGTSGNLAHSANLGLTVQSTVAAAISRTAYVRKVSIPSFNQPADEPRHRHLVYDPSNHHLFVANDAANRVEVFSSQDASLVASVMFPERVARNCRRTVRQSTPVPSGNKSLAVSFVDMKRLRITLPAGITSRPQRLTIANPDAEIIAVDAAVNVN